jgi:hypothetical protein
MNVHEHTRAAIGCTVGRIALASPSTLNIDIRHLQVRVSLSSKTDHIGATAMRERIDQGHPHPKLEVPRLTCLGLESNPNLLGGRQAL